MHKENNSILLVSMPFAGIEIPSIQLALLESYLKERNVNIQTRHLYLKAAEFYGLNNYNYLIYPPNDSYTAQMAYSRYVFPDHYQKNEQKLKNYFNKKSKEDFSFENYIEKTDIFYNWALKNISWENFDIVGFTLNYGQFLPSLAIAKQIKEVDPSKKIILGGSRTVGILGRNTLKSFPFIDYIVSGDGEESLHTLALDSNDPKDVPNLIYRQNNEIKYNEPQNVDINNLPLPDYTSFYQELQTLNPEIQQYFIYNGRFPLEISRGCWWNKCTFCNLNIQHKKYREKNVDKIVKELSFLSDTYKALSFQIIGNTLPIKDLQLLCETIINLGKDFTFYAEARADHMKKEDYRFLSKAGFIHIQTGVESFSPSYLKKMNKGAKTIENIAAIIHCQENKIKNHYNFIVGYPNEEDTDFEETKQITNLFKSYLDPPQICFLKVMHGSSIQQNPYEYNIENLEYSEIDKLMFPLDILQNGINFVYDFQTDIPVDTDRWEQLINFWIGERHQRKIDAVNSQAEIDKLIFYYKDGGQFLKIFDKRQKENIAVYNLDQNERKIFLDCKDVITIEKIKEKNQDLSENKILEILKSFEEAGIIFREYDSFLSLPLSYNTLYNNIEQSKKHEKTLYETA